MPYFYSKFLPRSPWRLCKLGSGNRRRTDRWPDFWCRPTRQPKERIPSANHETASLDKVITNSAGLPDSKTSRIWNEKTRVVLVNDHDTTWSILMEGINGGKNATLIFRTKDSGLHDFREVIAFRCDACVAAMLLARTAYYYPKTSITCRWSAWSDVSNPDLSGDCTLNSTFCINPFLL